MVRKKTAFTIAATASLSSWTWFGVNAPNGLVLPAELEGAALVFVGAEAAATGLADAATAQDLVDVRGLRQHILVVAGTRPIWVPDALRVQGWIALRAVQSNLTTAVAQAALRTGHWLHEAEG